MRDQLIAAGIPANVADYAISFRPSKRLYAAFSFLLLATMAAGFIAGVFLWRYFDNVLDQNALNTASQIYGLLYEHNFGLAGLIAIFAWIAITGVIIYSFQSLSKKFQATIFVFSILDPKNAPYIKLIKNKSLDHANDPAKYIRISINGWRRVVLWPAIILTLLTFATLERELETYTIYTMDGYIATSLFPWEEDKSDKWENAKLVKIGCNHVTGKNASDDIIYDVSFKNGRSQRISDARSVSGRWLDDIEKIDGILVGAGAEFQRWQWNKRDPLHPSCLAYYKLKYSKSDYERLEKILRIGQL